jgi:hypothetical protein
MTDHVNLEIRLRSLNEAGHYPVETSLHRPDSGATTDRAGEAQFDLEALEALALKGDHDAYGKALAVSLFGPHSVRDHFVEARQAADDQDPTVPLRVRLRIDPGAPELHRLRWELMHDPQNPDNPLSVDENKPLSRFLTSPDGRPVRTRPQAGIRALVVIANPSNLSERQGEDGAVLAPVPVEEELARARKALLPIPVTALCSDPALERAGRPTLQEMLSHLRDGYDVLYLVCHGALFKSGNPVLWLEDKEGKVDRVSATDTVRPDGRKELGLVSQLDALPRLPRLVVLASCQSASHRPEEEGHAAGPGEAEAEPASRETRAWTALGPRLAEIGVPAVVAMQGSITMKTVEAFMPVLFAELRRDGHIDRAVAAARRAVHERPDWWLPVLFSRLEDGLLFGSYGLLVGEQPEVFWKTLLENVADGECTPFLGPGVTADLLPTPTDLAQTLASDYHYPLAYTNDLARVGQFIAAEDNRALRKKVVRTLIDGFKRRQGLIPDTQDHKRGLSGTIVATEWLDRAQQLAEPEIHHQLASLNLPLYLTTNFDNFMTLALQARRPPEQRDRVRRLAVPWRQEEDKDSDGLRYDLDPPPSGEDPVVLHLFGTDDDLLSLVLTEDDYLDYLARISRDHEVLLPTNVNDILASTSLLFLGYDLHDLALKVILRGLLAKLDLGKWSMKHVAVQLEPSVIEPARQQEAMDNLRKYFSRSSKVKIDVYWGSTHQFVADLHRRWQQEVGHG